MKRISKPTGSRLLPYLLMSSVMLSPGCTLFGHGGGGVAEVRCPRPSIDEAQDYNSLAPPPGELPRPTMQWVGRLINYCWPEAAEAARQAAAERAAEDAAADGE